MISACSVQCTFNILLSLPTQLQEVCEKLNESDRVSTFVLRNTSLTKAGLQQIQPALSSAAQNLKVRFHNTIWVCRSRYGSIVRN